MCIHGPGRDGIVVSVSASRVVGRGFACRPGLTKGHYKSGTNCTSASHSGFGIGDWQCNPTVLRYIDTAFEK